MLLQYQDKNVFFAMHMSNLNPRELSKDHPLRNMGPFQSDFTCREWQEGRVLPKVSILV